MDINKKATLQRIFEGFPLSDKLEHGYIPYYEKHLPKQPKNLLEIGLAKGDSIRAWASHFCTKKTEKIYCLEVFGSYETCPKQLIEAYDCRIEVIEGSQADVSLLQSLEDTFSIVIDDGSHIQGHQQISLRHLWGKVKRKGLYVIEYLHCSDPINKTWWHEHDQKFGITKEYDTTLNYLKRLEKAFKQGYGNTQNLGTKFLDDSFNNRIISEISEINIYDDKICFINKK
jgi:hypothetical protein